MIVQNNYAALVFLAVVILAGAVVLGLLLTNTEILNPAKANQEANAYATKSALDARERAGILQATETPRALLVAALQTQTTDAINASRAIAQATAIPAQQTVTHATLQAEVNAAQVRATQTVLLVKARNEELQAQATATSIAGAIISDANKRDNDNTREMALTIAMAVAITVTAASGATLIVANAKAKTSAAAAALEREKRRTLEVQTAVQTLTPSNIIPLPTARTPKNGHGEQEKIAA